MCTQQKQGGWHAHAGESNRDAAGVDRVVISIASDDHDATVTVYIMVLKDDLERMRKRLTCLLRNHTLAVVLACGKGTERVTYQFE